MATSVLAVMMSVAPANAEHAQEKQYLGVSLQPDSSAAEICSRAGRRDGHNHSQQRVSHQMGSRTGENFAQWACMSTSFRHRYLISVATLVLAEMLSERQPAPERVMLQGQGRIARDITIRNIFAHCEFTAVEAALSHCLSCLGLFTHV